MYYHCTCFLFCIETELLLLQQCPASAWSDLATDDLLTGGLSGIGSSAVNDRGAESYNWRLKDQLLSSIKDKEETSSSSGEYSSSGDESEDGTTVAELPETFGVIQEKPKRKSAKERLGKKKEFLKERHYEKESFNRKENEKHSSSQMDTEVIKEKPRCIPSSEPVNNYSRKRRWNEGGQPNNNPSMVNPFLEHKHKDMKKVTVSADMAPDELVDITLDALHEPDSNRELWSKLLYTFLDSCYTQIIYIMAADTSLFKSSYTSSILMFSSVIFLNLVLEKTNLRH